MVLQIFFHYEILDNIFPTANTIEFDKSDVIIMIIFGYITVSQKFIQIALNLYILVKNVLHVNKGPWMKFTTINFKFYGLKEMIRQNSNIVFYKKNLPNRICSLIVLQKVQIFLCNPLHNFLLVHIHNWCTICHFNLFPRLSQHILSPLWFLTFAPSWTIGSTLRISFS